MRPPLHAVLGFALIGTLAGSCATKQSAGGSDGGAQGGSAAATHAGSAGNAGSAGSRGGAAGASSSGAGGKAGSGTGGTGNGSGGGKEVGGSGAEGGDSGGTSGDGSGGAAAGTGGAGTSGTGSGGAGTAGVGGSSSCPSGQIWCAGCTIGSGTCAVACPAAACGPCDLVESIEDCEARTDCHSVFEDPQVCGCVGVGCCARFARCADNERADCTGANADCDAMTPYCEAPAYVVSYTGFCYEGCVDPKDCSPSPPTQCPPAVPIDGAACGGDAQCYYDACPEGGRAVATCGGRVWNVETGTSCTVECAGVGQQCSEGEICLVHAGGALLVDCTENGCGTGPILEECAGNCPVSFSLDGGATATCNTCPQGGCP